jgi:hypothetical protein
MAKRTRPVKPLNEPVQVHVKHDAHGVPIAVELVEVLPAGAHGERPLRPRSDYGKTRWVTVAKIEDIYEVDELWWRGEEQEIQRLYFDLRLENARKVTIYRDLVHNLWYRQAG